MMFAVDYPEDADGYVYGVVLSCVSSKGEPNKVLYIGETTQSLRTRINQHNRRGYDFSKDLPNPHSVDDNNQVYEIETVEIVIPVYEDEVKGDLKTYLRNLERETYQDQKPCPPQYIAVVRGGK